MDDIESIIQDEAENMDSFGGMFLDPVSARRRLSALPEVVRKQPEKRYLDYWEEIRKNCCVGYGLKCAMDIIKMYKDDMDFGSVWKKAYETAILNSECESCLLSYLKEGEAHGDGKY